MSPEVLRLIASAMEQIALVFVNDTQSARVGTHSLVWLGLETAIRDLREAQGRVDSPTP